MKKPSAAQHAVNVAVAANNAAYLRARQNSVPGACWDYLILTAANERQAAGYRAELALRHRDIGRTGAFFPVVQKSIVVADPPGRRVGSGGATLNAIQSLARQFQLSNKDLAQSRILLIHSGGASQRLPAYSPTGKIFSPLPMLRPDAQVSTLFDHLYTTLAGLPERLGPGMLVLAGDVFLVFDHRHVTTPNKGVTALTMRVPAEVGLAHGVFVTGKGDNIVKTLQKVSIDTMQKEGATDAQGSILLDTGILFFDSTATSAMASMSGILPESKALHDQTDKQIDLYDEMTSALASGTDNKSFIKSGPANIRKAIWKALHGLGFSAMRIDGHFLHLGTTLQFRDAMTGRDQSVAAELFQQNILTHSEWPIDAGARVYSSILLKEASTHGTIGKGTVIEHSILGPNVHIGRDCVVSQVFANSIDIKLGDEQLLFQVPVRDAKGKLLFVHVLCGVKDDFKGKFTDNKCLYLNHNISEFIARHKLKPTDIWPGIAPENRTLWTARLFPATTARDAAQTAMWLAQSSKASAKTIAQWKKSPRFSMAMILEQVDATELIAHREVVTAHLQTLALLDAIDRDDNVSMETVLSHYISKHAYDACRELIHRYTFAQASDPAQALRQARAMWALSQLYQRANRPDHRDAMTQVDPVQQQAFVRVGMASEIGYGRLNLVPHHVPKLTVNQTFEARSPVRLDLAGGWTDTPPYCYERGGHVVNVAIDLENHPPVRAVVRTIPQPHIVLDSQDLGRKVVLDSWDASRIRLDDPFALHRVALGMVGLVPSDGSPLKNFLQKAGAGLSISTECRVPKGSGLGTSSILAATLLAALYKVRGIDHSHESLIEATLLTEQRLGTGRRLAGSGGWDCRRCEINPYQARRTTATSGGNTISLRRPARRTGITPSRLFLRTTALSSRYFASRDGQTS